MYRDTKWGEEMGCDGERKEKGKDKKRGEVRKERTE